MRSETIPARVTAKQPSASTAWIQEEVEGCVFADVRLTRRFGSLLEMISHGVGDSLPAACQDWANTKAAYRFLSNERVTEEEILAGHFQASATRTELVKGPLLVLHDTCEFSYERGDSCSLGLISRPSTGRGKDGRLRHHTVRGILMHSSLVVTPAGLPLGLAAIKFWTRKQFKGCNALKRQINPTRVPIEEKESYRWLENLRQSTVLLRRPGDCVHIGDRESDIYELFCAAAEMETRFLVRTCVDRLAGDGDRTVAEMMRESRPKGTHRVRARTKEGVDYEAVLQIKYERLLVRPPIGKQKDYPDLMLTVLAWVRPREIGMVRPALEDRDLPQGSEVWLQGEGVEIAHLGTFGEPDLGLLHHRLAHLLADHAWAGRGGSIAEGRIDRHRDSPVGSLGEGESWTTCTRARAVPLHHQTGAARWLPRQGGRSATGESGDVARPLPSQRHPTWIFNRY